MMNIFRKYALFLARADIVFYILIWLMILLIAGTIAQKYVGLYRAQETYFFSLVLWLGPVPLPGGLAAMGAFTLTLLCKMLFASPWSWQKSGSLITHTGALLLLTGGLLTFAHAQEGNMVIREGETVDFIAAYHDRELVVESPETGEKIAFFPWSALKPGKILSPPALPGLSVEIVKLCRNCAFLPQTLSEDDPGYHELKGRTRNFDIAPAPLETEDEINRSAVQFRIHGADSDQDGIYFSADFIDASPAIDLNGKTYNIALRKKRTQLPFAIKLVDFEKQNHPGTSMARSYHSEVLLIDGKSEWRSMIRMNEPLRYKGYTFYQSSFIDDGESQATVLAVVKNAGRMFPYIASIVMCAGLLIHMAIYLPRLIGKLKRRVRAGTLPALLIACTVLAAASPARAAPPPPPAFDMSDFSRIPVLDKGRIKPLDTFARTHLEIFNGRDSLPGLSASQWLAETLLDPARAYDRALFNIPNPQVADALDLERRKDHRYSYREVVTAVAAHYKSWEPFFSAPEKDLTLAQKQILDLYGKIRLFADISRSFSLVFPDFAVPPGPLEETLDSKTGTPLSYSQLSPYRPRIEDLLKPVAQKQAEAPDTLTEEDRNLVAFALQMLQREQDRGSSALRIVPPQWQTGEDGAQDLWFPPWTLAAQGQGSPDSARFLTLWQELAQAYRDADAGRWRALTKKIRESSLMMSAGKTSPALLDAELSFNQWKPFHLSLSFYIAAFLLTMAGLAVWHAPLRKAALSLLLCGLAFHIGGIGTRMLIMERPPVTNLYESIVFVALIVVLFGTVLELRLKNLLGLMIAATVGTILHFIGIRFDADGDTMGMLVAVLDTNFWLSTHVVTITIGYGCCLVAGVLGHIALIRRLLRPDDRETLTLLHRNMQGAIIVSLFFAALGTILGGIWADQSWGRFWGWDPKENGALLIVLWLAWLIHGRLAGILGEAGFAAGTALTTVTVALAWFGVNLLSIGLHSYGFTQGAALSFVLFCGGEIALVLTLYSLIKFRSISPPTNGAAAP